MVRLFVGGLPGGITDAELLGRFKAFGDVTGCELVPHKATSDDSAQAGCRGFAYLDLTPTDDTALRKCLSLVRSNLVCCKHRSRHACNASCRSKAHAHAHTDSCILLVTVQWLQVEGKRVAGRDG